MDLSFLMTAFDTVGQAVLGAVVLAVGIWIVPVVVNAFLDMLHWPAEARLKLPDNFMDLNWLRNPWVAAYTLGAVGAVIAFFVQLL